MHCNFKGASKISQQEGDDRARLRLSGWRALLLLLAATALMAPAQPSGAQTLTPLYSFTGGSNGKNPYGDLIQASDGNLYGMTNQGGANGYGTVFQITTAGTPGWTYSFTYGSDGGTPLGSLIQASDGNLYGMTQNGGVNGYGTVFQITTAGTLGWTYGFTGGADGANPQGSLIQAADGNLYGMTHQGGASGYGTVFQITPSGTLGWTYGFTGGSDGANPSSSLIQATGGNLYGMTDTGGAHDKGAVFQITPSGTLGWTYGFTGGSDGEYPSGSLMQATDGNLYGMTTYGGSGSGGAAFQLSTAGILGWTYGFTYGRDGGNPLGSLVQASDGNFYGMTQSGGIYGTGAVFQLTSSGTLGWTYGFTGGSDGANPYGSLMQATTDGNLYGMTNGGGVNNDGEMFKIALPVTLILSKSTCTAGDKLTGTVTLNVPAPAAGQNVAITGQVSGISYQTSVYIHPGQSNGAFPITTSASLASNTSTMVIATANGASSQQTLTVKAEAITSITATKSAILAGGDNQITVTVSQPAPASGVSVSLSSNNSGVSIQSSYGMGTAATSFMVTLTSSAAAFSSNATVTITASLSNGSSKSVSFTVGTAQTSIAVAPASGMSGQASTLSAALKDSLGNPISFVNLTFQVGSGAAFSATTNASGVASPGYTIPNDPGSSLPITVTFAGNSTHSGSTGTGALMVQKLPTMITVATVSGSAGQTIALSATLTSSGKPLSFVTVTFTVGAGTPFTATTNASGVASPGYVIPPNTPGPITVTVTYAGNSTYSGSSGTGSITVN